MAGASATPSRRAFLAGASLVLLGGGVAGANRRSETPGEGDWDDPRMWPGRRVPGAADTAVISRTVRLARDVAVRGVLIAAGGALILDPDHDVTLSSSGSVVVEGHLVTRPRSRVHGIVFTGVREDLFRGGHEGTPETDTGLWVQQGGVLDADGGGRRSWSRLAAAAPAGATSLRLIDVPRGWRAGDELVLVPTGGQHQPGQGYDTTFVRAVDGHIVHLDRPLNWDHTPTAVPGTGSLGAEVLNLTRDVVVRGTPTGRAHVIVQSAGRQALRGVRMEHLGPAAVVGSESTATGQPVPVMGRYGLHLHHCGDATRGLVVDEVVVVRCGNHALVAHESPGVTFRDCIAHDTTLSQYWWDAQGLADSTDDVTYERCVASLARAAPGVAAGTPHLSRRIAGFDLLRGTGNRAVDCVAVGNAAGLESAGFVWQEDAEGVWQTAGCSSHDNAQHGSFVWQNTHERHVVDRLYAFHNGGYGFVHGAYSNSYSYVGCVSYANRQGAVLRHANAAQSGPEQQWRDCVFDAAGLSEYLVVNGPHEFPPTAPVVFHRCTMRGARTAALVQYDSSDIRSWTSVDLVDCHIEGLDLHVQSTYEASRWRVQNDQKAVELQPDASGASERGALTERPIAPFAT